MQSYQGFASILFLYLTESYGIAFISCQLLGDLYGEFSVLTICLSLHSVKIAIINGRNLYTPVLNKRFGLSV